MTGGPESSGSYNSELQRMITELNLRYEDFYRRLRLNQQMDLERRRGAQAFKDERERHRRELEEARRQYASLPKDSMDQEREMGRLDYERELLAKRQRSEQARREYIRRQETLKQIREKGHHIPPEVELTLRPPETLTQ